MENRQRMLQRARYAEEDDYYRLPRHGVLHELISWIIGLALAIGGALLFIVVLTNWNTVVSIATIVFYILCAVIGIALLCAVAFLVSWCVRHITGTQVIEPGEKGVWIRDIFGRMKVLSPVKEATPKQANGRANGEDEHKGMPKFVDLVTEGFIIPGMIEIVLGIQNLVDVLQGTWDDVKSFAVYGFARVGKTNTLIFYIVQAIFTGCRVVVCDHHIAKGTGLSNLLQPLRRWLTICTDVDEIVSEIINFDQELQTRQLPQNKGTLWPIWFLAIDEWNGLLDKVDKRTRKRLVEILERINREAAGFNLLLMVAIHELDERSIGSATLRQSFLGVVCHAIDIGYSKWVFVNNKHQKITATLKKGEILLRNAETREVVQLHIPRMTTKDIALAAQKMMEYDMSRGNEEYEDDLYNNANEPTIPLSISYHDQTLKEAFIAKQSDTSRVTSNASNNSSTSNGESMHEAATQAIGSYGSGYTGTSMNQDVQGLNPSNGSNQADLSEDATMAAIRAIGKRLINGETPDDIRKSFGDGFKSGRRFYEARETIKLVQDMIDSGALNNDNV